MRQLTSQPRSWRVPSLPSPEHSRRVYRRDRTFATPDNCTPEPNHRAHLLPWSGFSVSWGFGYCYDKRVRDVGKGFGWCRPLLTIEVSDGLRKQCTSERSDGVLWDEGSYILTHTYDRFLATSHHYRGKNREKIEQLFLTKVSDRE